MEIFLVQILYSIERPAGILHFWEDHVSLRTLWLNLKFGIIVTTHCTRMLSDTSYGRQSVAGSLALVTILSDARLFHNLSITSSRCKRLFEDFSSLTYIAIWSKTSSNAFLIVNLFLLMIWRQDKTYPAPSLNRYFSTRQKKNNFFVTGTLIFCLHNY